MDSKEVALDLFPYLKVYKDGTLERVAGVEVVPPGLDPETNVLSKDIVIVPETGVSARIYRSNLATEHQKLPLVVYFHGGAFCVASPAFPNYHNNLNKLVAEANIVALSVGYRLVPEHPLPTAYEDSWSALQWVASHKDEEGNHEAWIKNYAEFKNVFLAGDSAGANIAHHLALRIKESNLGHKLQIRGIGMIHPYFWGTNPIGSEMSDRLRKDLVDKWWLYVCPSDKGCDDPLINPFVDGSPDLAGLACDRTLVIVAEKDILKDRGMLYYDELVKSGWKGKAEIMETEGEDHVFHIFNPECDKAKSLIKRLASFINQGKAPVE
ncbi:putative carboxylesterase 2 [Hibiscus syriacus]|uniref:Carboxylesterase 2 n=1 Tax=Hibiscus syriacus TaxID=106335 RepID=A0A6A2XS01_HIBSY|nr:probable carboxylesterase 2 [Hibiscus syriacus]KAE8659097.1 putative carboxylesterase 2 [Hibiscus syriacus]